MKNRVAFAAAAATLGAAALVVAPFATHSASPATASAPRLPIYAVHGTAKGIDFEFALRPNLFDPIMQFAGAYASTKIDSSGDGSANALASEVYPGSLITGFRGCQGLPGTVQAAYPTQRKCSTASPSQSGRIIPFPPIGPLSIQDGEMRADAVLAHSRGVVTMANLSFTPSETVAVTIASLSVVSDSLGTVRGLEQTTSVVVKGIKIAADQLSIDLESLVSRATSTSDGATGVAHATLTLGDVTVTIQGVKHRAVIDNTGIHLKDLHGPGTPPQAPLPDEVRQPLSAELPSALGQAKIDLRLAMPVELESGARAESSIGGLVVSFESGRPPYPRLPPPPTPLPQVPNICPTGGPPPVLPSPFPSDNPFEGVCFGPGLLPIPPGNIATSISIGGADALALAAQGFTFRPPTGGGSFPTGGFGGFPGTPGRFVGGGVGTAPTFAPAAPAAPVQPPQQQLLGLAARLPSAALVGSGLFFLVLALGLAWAPSLRP
jgi:hypothetical protein